MQLPDWIFCSQLRLSYFQLFPTIQHTTGMKIITNWYDPLVAIDELGPFRKYLFWNLTENAKALNTNRRTESKCVYISVFIYQTNRFFKVLLHNNRDCSQGHCKMISHLFPFIHIDIKKSAIKFGLHLIFLLKNQDVLHRLTRIACGAN